MNLFDFSRNGLVTPKMIKLETESQIPTGGHFRFLMVPFLLLISLTIYCLIEKFGLLVPRNDKFKHAFPSSAKVSLTSYIMMPPLSSVILCRAWKANCSDLLIENCHVKERVPRK